MVFAYSHHHHNHYPSHCHWWSFTIINITIIVIGRAARVVCVYLHPNWMVLARGGPFHHQPSRALFITKSSSFITIKRHHHNQSLILLTYSSSPLIIIVIHKTFKMLSTYSKSKHVFKNPNYVLPTGFVLPILKTLLQHNVSKTFYVLSLKN